jgi:hypothetical protein
MPSVVEARLRLNRMHSLAFGTQVVVHELGTHADCGGPVVFISDDTCGFRFCCMCEARGPEAQLATEKGTLAT